MFGLRRIHQADALRGLSLVGILLANLLIFQYGLTGQDYLEYMNIGPLSNALAIAMKVLIVHSFIPIFGILFGFSMDKLFQSMKRKNIKAKRFKLLLRAIALMVLGAIHAQFIWHGDILLTYGMTMLILIVFINFKTGFFKWCIWIISAISIFIIIASLFYSEPTEEIGTEKIKNYLSQTSNIYQNGSYYDIHFTIDSIEDPTLEKWGVSNEEKGLLFLAVPLSILPLFIIGVYLSRTDWFLSVTEGFWRNRLWLYLIPVSIVIKFLHLLLPTGFFESASTFFDVVLAVGYMVVFKWLYERFQGHSVMQGLESMGKMSLTMYIAQSIFGTLVFYSYGLGLFNTNILWLSVPVFVAFYCLQVYIAKQYMKHWRYGPLEYILRVVTYLKIKPQKVKMTQDKV